MFDTNEENAKIPRTGGVPQRRGAPTALDGGGERPRRCAGRCAGSCSCRVARQYDLIPQQLSNWIKAAKEGRVMLPAPEPDGEFGEATDAAFVPVVAVQPPEAAGADAASCIEIVAGSVLVRVPLGADVRTLAAILRAVR